MMMMLRNKRDRYADRRALTPFHLLTGQAPADVQVKTSGFSLHFSPFT